MMEYQSQSQTQHKPGNVAVQVFTIALYGVTLVFNAMASGALPNQIFQNTTAEVSRFYFTDITPAGWTFSIWAVIYTWQGLWLVYGLTLACRTTGYGYLYVNPNPQPNAVYVSYMFNLMCNVSWLLLWDRFYPQYALIFLTLMAVTLYICIGISTYKLYNASPTLIREGAKKDMWFTRVFTHNGLAIYAAWVSIATIINLDVVLIYFTDLSIKTSGTISLAILFLQVVTWFFLDNFILDRFLRYILTPYAVFIFALVGILFKNWDPSDSNSILTSCLLVIASVAAVAKLGIVVWKHNRRPLFGDVGFYTQQVTYGSLRDDKEYTESFLK